MKQVNKLKQNYKTTDKENPSMLNTIFDVPHFNIVIITFEYKSCNFNSSFLA